MKNNKWLIGIDLDGTTCMSKEKPSDPSSRRINPINIEIFKELDKLGHKVVIATGRGFFESKLEYEMIGANNPILNNAGAHIHIPGSDELYEEILLDNNVLNKIINDERLKEHIVAFSISTSKGCYIHEYKESGFRKYLSSQRNVLPYEFDGKIKENALSSNITFDKEAFLNQDLFEYIVENYGETMHHTKWGNNVCGHGIEINVRNANKGISLLRIADFYGIDHEHTIAFGDGTNDVEFLKLAKIGVAIKNSYDGLFQYADEVTEYDNNEGGVGLHLKKMFNL